AGWTPRVAVVGRGDPEPPRDPGALDRYQEIGDLRDQLRLGRAHRGAVVDHQQDRDGLRGHVALPAPAVAIAIAGRALTLVAHTSAPGRPAGVATRTDAKLAAVVGGRAGPGSVAGDQASEVDGVEALLAGVAAGRPGHRVGVLPAGSAGSVDG